VRQQRSGISPQNPRSAVLVHVFFFSIENPFGVGTKGCTPGNWSKLVGESKPSVQVDSDLNGNVAAYLAKLMALDRNSY
jgi:hypothetical protein